jgi:ribosome recycling factor
MCNGLLAKISGMAITEEEKKSAWEEIERVVRQAKFFVRAVRHDGEKVCLWLLPEGEAVKVVEMGDSPERRRLRVLITSL